MSRKLSKGRSYKTNQNKLRTLKKVYRLSYKHSEENYKRNEKKGYKKPDSSYFFMRYPNEQSFLKVIKIKEVLSKK